MTDVAIVIPAYNVGPYLSDTIDSVMAQTVEDWITIVVDDGSTDDTLEVAKRAADRDTRILVSTQGNAGLVGARNAGILLLPDDVELVLFLDGDDLLTSDCLEVLQTALRAAPSSVAAAGTSVLFDHGAPVPDVPVESTFGFRRHVVTERWCRRLRADEATPFESFVIWVNIATAGSVLIRRTALDRAGPFPPEVPIGEDWDQWLRLSALGSFEFVPQVVLHKRVVTGSFSSDGRALGTAEMRIRRRLAELPNYSTDQRRIARRGHFWSCVIKLGWVVDDLRRHRVRAAVGNLYRTGRSFGRWATFGWSR